MGSPNLSTMNDRITYINTHHYIALNFMSNALINLSEEQM
jgi:hypothetical protein